MRASAVLALILVTAAPAAAQTLVYRVDQATAVIDGGRLIVTAKGAVRTGGWEKPRLIVRKSTHSPGNVEVAFVATPPEDRAVVVQSILPIRVKLITRLPRNSVAAVRVVSETNSVTAQIIPKYEREKTASR